MGATYRAAVGRRPGTGTFGTVEMLAAVPADAVLDHLGPGPTSSCRWPTASRSPCSTPSRRTPASSSGVRVHQMHALHDRPYLHGAFGDRLRHVSYFLSHVTRPCFRAGTIDLVPNNFSEMRAILRTRTTRPPRARRGLAAGPPRLLQPRPQRRLRGVVHRPGPLLPRGQRSGCRARSAGTRSTSARCVGWVEADYPLRRGAPPAPHASSTTAIAALRRRAHPRPAPRSRPASASIPNAILAALRDHRDLGVHTELISDGVMDLVERGVVNGVAKQLNRTKTVGTFALGTQRLYDFLDENTAVRAVAGALRQRPSGHRPGARLRVDQRDASRSTCSASAPPRPSAGAYYSSSGGQADFARGAMYSKGGQGFVVLHSTAKDDGISKIVPQLAAGDVVTTLKNTVDKVVTEWGVAELRGRSIRERASALIAIAHPDHRDDPHRGGCADGLPRSRRPARPPPRR